MGFRRRIRVGGGGGVVFTTEYQAVLDYATTQGFTKPSAGNQTTQNALIVAMKAAAVWDNLDVFYNFYTDGDANFAKINWKAPGSNQLTQVSPTITFTPLGGFKGDGSTGDLSTGYTPPGTQMTTTDFGYFFDANAVGDTGYIFANNGIAATYSSAPNIVLGSAQGNSMQVPTDGVGFYTLNMVGDVRFAGINGVVVANNNFGGAAPVFDAVNPVHLLRHIGFASSSATLKCWGVGAHFNTKEGALFSAWGTYLATTTTFEAEYQAILSYAATQSYALPSQAGRFAQNKLVKDLKAAGIWADMDVLYVLATDGDREFAKINWKAPGTFQGTETGPPLFFTNQGFTGRTSPASRIVTNWTPSTHGVKYTLNEAGFYFYINSDLDSTGVDVGARNTTTTDRIHGLTRDGTAQNRGSFAINGLTLLSANGSVTNSSGLWHVKRLTNLTTGQKVFRNGVSVTVSGQASIGLPNLPVSLLSDTNTGGVILLPSSRQMSFFAAGASLDTKEAALNTIWNNYFTALPTSYLAEYLVLILLALSLGYTLPDPATQTKQNNFISALKQAGVWDQLDALWIPASASAGLGRLNWKDPLNHQATEHGTIVFTPNQGFQGDGVTGYLNLHWNPSVDAVNFQQDDSSILFASSTNANLGINDRPIGAWDLTRAIQLVPRHGADEASYSLNDGTFVPSTGTVPDSSGIFQVQRTNGAATSLFRNGSLVGATLAPSLGLPTVDVYAGAVNFNGAPSLFSSRNIGLIAFGSAMDGKETQIAEIWNAFNA